MELNIWQLTGALSAAVILGILITLVIRQWLSKRSEAKEIREGNSIWWRKNVLALLSMAYGSLLILFILMTAFGATSKEAYEVLGVPFVALIGGTLTIAKDLID